MTARRYILLVIDWTKLIDMVRTGPLEAISSFLSSYSDEKKEKDKNKEVRHEGSNQDSIENRSEEEQE